MNQSYTKYKIENKTFLKYIWLALITVIMILGNKISAFAQDIYVPYGSSIYDDWILDNWTYRNTTSFGINITYTKTNGSTYTQYCKYVQGSKTDSWDGGFMYEYSSRPRYTFSDVAGCSKLQIDQEGWYERDKDADTFEKMIDIWLDVINITGTVTITATASGQENDDDSVTVRYIACTSHTYGSTTVTTAATCTTAGAGTHKCTKCGYTENVTIAAKGHTYGTKTVSSTYLKSSATCTAAAVYYYKCNNCTAKGTNTYTNGSALGHAYNTKTATSTYLKKESTCISLAEYYYKCDRCTASSKGATNTYYTTGTVSGHDYSSKTVSDTYLKSAATCTTKAVYYYKCSRCTASSKGDTNTTYENGNVLGHNYIESPTADFLKKAKTCTTRAEYYYKCSRCNRSSNGDTNAFYYYGELEGHKYNTKSITDTYKRTDATCTIASTYYYKCDNCTASSYGDTNTYYVHEALGHDFTYKESTETYLKNEVSCTLPLTYYYKCSRCVESSIIETGVTYTIGEPLGHIGTGWEHDNEYHWQTCERCQETFDRAKFPDEDNNDRCDVCYNKYLEMGLSNKDFEVTATDTVVLYPEIINDGNTTNYNIKWYESTDDATSWNLVYETDQEAVSKNQSKQKLAYTFTVNTEHTFNQYRYELTNEAGTISSGYTTLFVFEDYRIVDNKLTIVSTGYLSGLVEQNYPMNDYNDLRWNGRLPRWKNILYEHLTIEDHITTIGAEAFKDSTGLERITFSQNYITDINASAFENSAIVSAVIPESVKNVKMYAFKNCNNLLDITFLRNDTIISEEVGTIPGSSDIGIEKYNRNTDKYNRRHGFPVVYGKGGGPVEAWVNKFNSGTKISYNFMSITDSKGTVIDWKYDIDETNGTIKNLYIGNEINGTVRIPKSINGYLVKEVGNITTSDANGNVIIRDITGKQIDEDEEGNAISDENTTLLVLMIPDTVETIGRYVVVNAPNLIEIYNEAYFPQNFEYTMSNGEKLDTTKSAFIEIGTTTIYPGEKEPDDEEEEEATGYSLMTLSDETLMEDFEEEIEEEIEEEETDDNDAAGYKTIYFYSMNPQFNEAISEEYNRVLYDKELTGVSKGLSYKIDLRLKKIDVEQFLGDTYTDTPFDWAKDYVKTINILAGTQKILAETFKDFTLVKTVNNKSNDITIIDPTAFDNLGTDVEGNKNAQSYVSNELYDALTAKGFKFTFNDTTKYCGTLTTSIYPVKFEFLASSGKLTLSPYSEGSDSVMNNYTELTIPWRCVKDLITEVEINANVTNLSPYSFTGLANLVQVYNRAEAQTVPGEIFDIMERYEYSDISDEEYAIHIPDPTNYTDIIAKLTEKGFGSITEADLQGITIAAGKHYVYSYLIKDEVLEELQKDRKWIVPVYCDIEANPEFANKVPQPETTGYKLESIYVSVGICGDNAKWKITRDGILMISGNGAVYDYLADGEGNDVPWAEFRDSVTGVDIARGITRIGSYAFNNLKKVNEISFPSSVTSVGIQAFTESGIDSFNLTENLTQIDGNLFTGCRDLVTIGGTDNNYHIVDGILYSKDDSVLVAYLRDQIYNSDTMEPYEEYDKFTIPETVTVIAPMAFYEVDTINTIYMLDSLEEIGDKAFAEMDRLYYVDSKAGESLLANTTEIVMTVAENAFENSATMYSTREMLLYSNNKQLETAALYAGYGVRYYDNLMIDHINARYNGSPLVLNSTLPMKDVIFEIVYASGLSETVNGNDIRFLLNGNGKITTIGENKFNATYSDGYTDPVITDTFFVEGINAIVDMAAKYTGLDVWYGEKFDKANVIITLKYANGDIEHTTGENEHVTFDKEIIQTLNTTTVNGTVINDVTGKESVVVTFDDKQNKVFKDTIEITCSDYIEDLTAEYTGTAKVESTAGLSGLTDQVKSNIKVHLKWKSSDVLETKVGTDGTVSYDGGTDVVGEHLQFLVGYNKLNRYNKSAVLNIPCATNIANIMFTYTGTAVTKGTSINLSNILITVQYKDGTQKNFKADTVSDAVVLSPSMISNYGDNLVDITYTAGGYTKTDQLHIQGTIATPIKLIVIERPKKSVYQVGDMFEADGLRVNCLYDNGEIEEVSDHIVIETPTIGENQKNVVISYTESRDGTEHTVRTYLSININANQKDLIREMIFRESYEIERILFRSKKTEDVAGADMAEAEEEGVAPVAEENESKWTEIQINDTSKGENTDLSASIKAGYGFEMKVFTRYQTNRGNEEFAAFMQKDAWDEEFKDTYASVAEYIDHEDEWAYLNEIYPQHVPTSNPDMLYVRIVKRGADSGDRFTMIGEKDFLIMDKTNKDEQNRLIDEGEWYNSSKIFEFPLRTVNEDGEVIYTDDENAGDRRLYVSRNAAESDAALTEYVIQIISPAWYGYESEPEYDSTEGKFIPNDYDLGTGITKSWYGGATERYLHSVYEFSLFVQKNDDIHTHILQ